MSTTSTVSHPVTLPVQTPVSTTTSTSLDLVATHLSGDPKTWGPSLWKFLHTMAANYPDLPNQQNKASARQFFYSLRHLLPCTVCQTHYQQLLSKNQPKVDSSKEMQEWVLWLHNEISVNITGKSAWSLKQTQETYQKIEESDHGLSHVHFITDLQNSQHNHLNNSHYINSDSAMIVRRVEGRVDGRVEGPGTGTQFHHPSSHPSTNQTPLNTDFNNNNNTQSATSRVFTIPQKTVLQFPSQSPFGTALPFGNSKLAMIKAMKSKLFNQQFYSKTSLNSFTIKPSFHLKTTNNINNNNNIGTKKLNSGIKNNANNKKACNAKNKSGCGKIVQDPKTGVMKKKSCGCGK